MTNLEQLHLFLRFHYAPWGAAKGAVWEDCDSGPYTEERVAEIASLIMAGELTLTDYEVQMLRIVADPEPPSDKQYAEQMDGCRSSHADADNLLCSILHDLGYRRTVASYRSVEREFDMANPKTG
jgi:hypothetical protein